MNTLLRVSSALASAIAVSFALAFPAAAAGADDEMFDWAAMAKSVAVAGKAHTTLDAWKHGPNSTYEMTRDSALKQVAERCPSIIANLPEEARPGLNVNFEEFCECYDSELVNLSLSAMFESNRMGEDGKTMAERRTAWEDLFDIPHEKRLGGCVVKTTQVK